MKCIQKSAEPPELTAWKSEWVGPGKTTTWEDLPGDVSRAIRQALFADQGHICCYCCRRIVDNDSHIEHLVPRNPRTGDPALTFSWDNLLASCQGNLMRGDPIHCGRKKDEWYDAALMVSPLRAGCEPRFRYELDGRMVAADDSDLTATETICRLDLDGERLRGLRRKAIEGLFADLDHDLSAEEIQRLAQAYRERDGQGRFEPFCTMLVAVLEFFCAKPAEPAPPAVPP